MSVMISFMSSVRSSSASMSLRWIASTSGSSAPPPCEMLSPETKTGRWRGVGRCTVSSTSMPARSSAVHSFEDMSSYSFALASASAM